MKQICHCLLVLLLFSCKERYEAPVKSPDTGYLVIEGVVNSGPGPVQIQLSRTSKLENRLLILEKGAAVRVEADDNTLYTLTETSSGQYTANDFNLPVAKRYRLRIRTANGQEYLSEYEAVIPNPPLDSVSWVKEGNDVQLSVNTNNPLNNTRYYQWDYKETWEIRSAYPSNIKYKIFRGPSRDEYTVEYRDSVNRTVDTSLLTCWQNFTSNELLLGTSAKLTRDVINLPLTRILSGSRKLSVLYSINVKQYGWSKKGYEFLERIKRNTQDIGSIFDAQPSELKGNIKCITDSTAPAIGYFNVTPVREKRLFITNQQVMGWNYRTDCYMIEIENKTDSIIKKGTGFTPTFIAETFFSAIISFFAAPNSCVDCRLIGSSIKPSFWP